MMIYRDSADGGVLLLESPLDPPKKGAAAGVTLGSAEEGLAEHGADLVLHARPVLLRRRLELPVLVFGQLHRPLEVRRRWRLRRLLLRHRRCRSLVLHQVPKTEIG